MKINESNFKVLCLKDDDIENSISNEVFFYKNEIINETKKAPTRHRYFR